MRTITSPASVLKILNPTLDLTSEFLEPTPMGSWRKCACKDTTEEMSKLVLSSASEFDSDILKRSRCKKVTQETEKSVPVKAGFKNFKIGGQ